MLAISFGLLGGAKDSVCALVSGFFYLATIPVVYLLGRRVFDHRIGVLSALVYTISALSLEYATSGLHLTLCIFLATSLLLSVHSVATASKNKSPGGAPALPRAALATTGAIAALLYLADPLFIWMLPVAAIAAIQAMPSKRGLAAIWLLAPVIVLAGPWMVRNAVLTGNPVFGLRGYELWMNTKNHFPSLTAYRMSPAEVFPSPGLMQDVIRKFVTGIGAVLDSWPNVGGNWVLVFFLPSLFFRFSDPVANSLRRVVLWAFVSLIGGMVLFQVQMPLLVTLVPGMLVFAIAYLVFLVQQAHLNRGAMARLTVAMAAVLLFPRLRTLAFSDKPVGIHEREAAGELATRSKPREVVLSDQPWSVGWYANRPAVLVPYSESRISDLRTQFSGLRWLFITKDVGYSGPVWGRFYQGLLVWNDAYYKASVEKTNPPADIQISGNSSPLISALSGFVTYPPLERGTPSTLVAYFPSQQSSNTNSAQPGTISMR